MTKLSNIINIDLHIHSNESSYKEKEGYVAESNINNIEILLKNLDINNINMFAITDHNRFSYELYSEVNKLIDTGKYKNVFTNLPGVEFDVQIEEQKPSCHIICIFDDKNKEKVENIEKVINNHLLKKPEEFYTRNKFEEILREIDLNVLLIAHQHKNFDNPNGGPKSISNSVSNLYDFIQTGYLNALEYQNANVQGIIINCLKKANTNVATIIGSDCHQWEYYPQKDKNTRQKDYITKIKALPNFDGLAFAFTNMENRFNRIENCNKNYISSIECNGNKYNLSNGINVIIGDNGSGKTFLMETINENKLPSYYEKLKKQNNIKIDKVGSPKIYYVRQNQIIEQVKKGELFKDSDLYNEINSISTFKSKIKKIAEDLIDYIKYNIRIRNKLDEINNSSIYIKDSNSKIFIPKGKIDIKTKENIYINRKDTISEIIKEIQEEFNNNKTIYREFKNEQKLILENLNKILSSLEKDNKKIEDENFIINQIIMSINLFNNKMDKNRTDKEKEEISYQKKKEDLENLIIEYIDLIKNKPVKPMFPEKIEGNAKKLHGGFVFVKKARYDNLDMKDIFLEELFVKDVEYENLFKIDTEEALSHDLNGIKKLEDIDTWYDKVDKFIDKYCQVENYIEKNNNKNLLGETPGEISSVHYEFVFNEYSNKYDTLLLDQPENDISNPRIKDDLLMYINQIRDTKQIIIVTHNPLLVVNLDVDNVICLNKNYKNELYIQDGCLEYENDEYRIIENVANIMDGGKEAIEKRFRLYRD